MKKRATLMDVARAAGVTMMTVSRAINNKSGVSASMRQKILDIARELDYQPNQIARGLATNQTTTVGLVVPDNSNPFFAQIARGVEDQAYEFGYNIFLINTSEDPAREQKALDSLLGKGVDGLILCSSRLSESRLVRYIERYSASVLLNRDIKGAIRNTTAINLNDLRAAQLAVEHFISLGRKNIAHICGPANSISSKKRLEGFTSALKANKFTSFDHLIERSAPDIPSGYAAAKFLLTVHPEIDAIYAFNDLVAVGAVQYCAETGRRIPQDIAVIGNDDIPLASIIRPRLTTIHFDQNFIGRLIMRTLLEIITGEVTPRAIQIEPELYIRESA
ncbi:MAG: LacI family transcriptional regulator [Leptolinea sp.]|nr:LacI family transcriptional regulator [Leptolinea sp.]